MGKEIFRYSRSLRKDYRHGSGKAEYERLRMAERNIPKLMIDWKHVIWRNTDLLAIRKNLILELLTKIGCSGIQCSGGVI